MRSGEARFGISLAVFSAATFGFGTTLARLAYDGGATPFTVVLLRTGMLVVLVGLPLLLMGRTFRIDRRTFLATLWMAVTLAMVSLGYQGAVAFIPVSLAALVFYSFPLLVGLIAVVAGRDRMTATKAIALLAAFLGLALALGPGFALLDWRGIALALLAAVGMSFTLAFGGEATRRADALVMSVYTNVWMLLAFAALCLAGQEIALPATLRGEISTAALCVTYVVAYAGWYLALSRVKPVRLAALYNVEPVVTLFAAWLILGERLSAVQLFGAALVLGSIGMMTDRDRTEPQTA